MIEVEKLFENYPVLRSIPQEDLHRLMATAMVMKLEAGKTVFDELQSCRAFPFILEGSIRVIKRAENGREISLYVVGPGDACVISAACVLGERPYHALGIVQADCTLVAMPSEGFEQLMGIKTFREYVFSLFSRRVIGLMQLIDEVAFRKLDQRLAAFLLASGRPLRMSHQEIADRLGTVREIITRLLDGFSHRGLVALKRGSIEIIDVPGLREASGQDISP